MSAAFKYSAFRARLRDHVGTRDTILHGFRLLRYALVQGPWQPLFVRYHQSRDNNPPLPLCAESLDPNVNVDDAVRRLDDEAYASGFVVPENLVDDIVAYARETGGMRIDEPHLQCESVHRIAHDPFIVAVVRGYLRAEPILLETKIFWTNPNPERRKAHAAAGIGRFHYDLSDIKALKVYVYLTDVDADSAPHVVIRGSQRRPLRLILRRNIPDEFAIRKYGDSIHTITGKRGTGWFEDVTCYHKQALGDKVRLMLTIIYSLHRQPLAVERGHAVTSPFAEAAGTAGTPSKSPGSTSISIRPS